MRLNQSITPQKTSNLCDLFGIDRSQKAVISLVGAGGKTTCMFSLTHELHGLGKRIAVTTHILRPDAAQGGALVPDANLERIEDALATSGMATVGAPTRNGKLSTPPEEVMRYLHRSVDFPLIEADGSRCLPIKAPRVGEPVIYSGTDRIAAVCGLLCLSEPISRVCHRFKERFCLLQQKGAGDRCW